NRLFDTYTAALAELLPAADSVRDAEDAWFFVHSLCERIWAWRFLYRDLNLLLSRNRHLEAGMRQVLLAQTAALRRLLAGLQGHGSLRLPADEADALATRQVVLLSYWLSYEYALDPRHALEAEGEATAALRGAGQALGLLLPYLVPAQQELLRHLLRAYTTEQPPGKSGVPHE
ncbi:MAG: TetR/AcrR family transcriptional regulator, partial [Curvibacter sp.]